MCMLEKPSDCNCRVVEYLCLFTCLFSSSSRVVLCLLSKPNPAKYKHTHSHNTYNLAAPSLIVRLFIRRGSNGASSRKQLSLRVSPACAWQQYQKAGEGVLILQRRHAPPTPPVSAAHHNEENQADAPKRLRRKQDRRIASPLHPRRVHTTVWKVSEEGGGKAG